MNPRMEDKSRHTPRGTLAAAQAPRTIAQAKADMAKAAPPRPPRPPEVSLKAGG